MTRNKFQKNLFKEYLTISGVFSFVCLIVFGITITSYFSTFWVEEQYVNLERNATAISRQIQYLNKNNMLTKENITVISAVGGETFDGYVFITDSEGKIITSNLKDTSSHGENLPEKTIDISRHSSFNGLSDLGGILKSKCFIASAVITDDNQNEIGFVFAGVLSAGMNRYLIKLIAIYLCISLLIMLMVVAGSYIVASQVVRPLREMGEAARRMANGDYSHKIKSSRNDEIGNLVEAFNEMAESVSRTESSRRGFLANVSHELKTPLTTISGFIDGMLDGTIEQSNHNKYLNIVSGEVKRMNALVMSMFNLSRLESGAMKPDFKPIDPSKTIVAVLLSFENRIDTKNIDIIGLENLTNTLVNADEGLFHQAIYNIVDNAVKFTEEGGKIWVFCEENEGKAVIRIRNSGRGIPPSDLSKIFDRFYKTDASRSVDKTGAGLGLSLVKTVADLHSGTVTVRSAEGYYTEFEMSFDIYQNEQPKLPDKKRNKNLN